MLFSAAHVVLENQLTFLSISSQSKKDLSPTKWDTQKKMLDYEQFLSKNCPMSHLGFPNQPKLTLYVFYGIKLTEISVFLIFLIFLDFV